jgi:3-hydroxybutyryl-CoA dehydrogenase
MKVLVLADDNQKEELIACPTDPNVQLQWLSGPVAPGQFQGMDACIDLLFENTKERVEWLKQLSIPVIVINSVIASLKEVQGDFVRINGWNTFLRRSIVEAACNNESIKSKAEQLFSYLGRKTEWVPDVIGFITPRVIASVINEAFIALEENVTTENEINTAMKLGTNYPFGPFEWGEKIGFHNIYSLLKALNTEQTRYKPSTLLQRRVLV